MKRFAVFILAIFILAPVTGCQLREPGSAPQEETGETTSPATLPPPSGAAPLDTIRVAIRPESDLNPLLPKHYATSSLLQLVYEPLYDVSHEGRLTGVLAKSCRWSADGLECAIQLEENHYFHNGQVVTAEDARASLEQYLAGLAGPDEDETGTPTDVFFQAAPFSGLEKWRLQSFENIIYTEVNEQGELVIGLSEADPLLARLLLFPVVPAGAAASRSMNPPAGSGEWQVESVTASGLVLTSGQEADIRRIEALVCPTAVEAAYAFDQGEIDLLLMDFAETALFADRSRIRKQSLEGGGFISLFFNNRTGQALTNRDALLYVMAADPELASMARPFSQAAYPVLRGDFRLRDTSLPPLQVAGIPEGFGSGDGEVIYDETGTPVTPERPSFSLLVPQDLVPARLVDRLSTAFLKINRKLQVEYADAATWPYVLSQRQYDAVLLVDTVFFFPDPADYLDGLQALGLYSWTEEAEAADRALLQEARLESLDPGGQEYSFSPASYAETVHRTFESLPLAGLAATGTMVWYSRDIEGTMSGTWHAPYRGVEDLLLWRR